MLLFQFYTISQHYPNFIAAIPLPKDHLKKHQYILAKSTQYRLEMAANYYLWSGYFTRNWRFHLKLDLVFHFHDYYYCYSFDYYGQPILLFVKCRFIFGFRDHLIKVLHLQD